MAPEAGAPTHVEPGTSGGDRVEEHDGVSVELPDGWHGRVLPVDSSAVLQAASFELLPDGIELPPGKEDPIKAMRGEDVLVTVLPCGVIGGNDPAELAPARIALDELSILPLGHPRIPRGHGLAHGAFRVSGRCLRIEVDFGSATPASPLKEIVNEVLASLSVS